MTRPHYVRNFALVGMSAAVLATLMPSLDGAPAAAPERFSLATSLNLSNYLEGQLRPASTRADLGTPDVGVGETAVGSQPSAGVGESSRAYVESIAVATPVSKTPGVGEFTRLSSTALNVRAGPSKTTGKLFVLQPGILVRIAETSGNWARIITADGATGWVFASYFRTAEAQVSADSEDVGMGVSQPLVESGDVASPAGAALAVENRTLVTENVEERPSLRQSIDVKRPATKVRAFRLANDIAMRSSPSKGSTKLSVIKGGSKLSVTEWDGSWARVTLADGTSGWINVR